MNDQEILALLASMNQWWENNPYYIVQMVTGGQYIDTTTTMYYFMEAGNRRRYRGETWNRVPFEAHFVFQNIDGVTYFQFPETNEYVANGAVLLYENFVQATLGDLTQANVLLKASKLREIRQNQGKPELFMVLDPKKLGVGPSTADITLIVRYDNNPRVTEFEQVRMGLRQKTVFQYLSTNRDEVLASLPQLPPVEQVSQIVNFDEALKRNMLHFRNLRTQEV